MNARLGRANFLLFSQLSTKSGEKMSYYRIARNAQAVKINWGRPSRSRHHAASPNVQQESLIHHRFFAWGERQCLRSRFTPRSNLVAQPEGSCPDLGHIACLLISIFENWERSKQTVCPKSGHEAMESSDLHLEPQNSYLLFECSHH